MRWREDQWEKEMFVRKQEKEGQVSKQTELGIQSGDQHHCHHFVVSVDEEDLWLWEFLGGVVASASVVAVEGLLGFVVVEAV